MRTFDFKKRKINRSIDEWTEICLAHIGWRCAIDDRAYHICNCGVMVLDEPHVYGQHGNAIMFRDWAKKALRDGEEWRIEEWETTLRQLEIPRKLMTRPEYLALSAAGGEGAIGNEAKSTSDMSPIPCETSDWTLNRVESILSEVAEPGMCESIVKVFGSESNASAVPPKVQSEPLPPTSKTSTSSGTQFGPIEIPSLPF